MNWTAGILAMKSRITPKELLLSRSTTLLSYQTSFSFTLVDGLEGRLKHVRTLNKVGFEKSKPTDDGDDHKEIFMMKTFSFLLPVQFCKYIYS